MSTITDRVAAGAAWLDAERPGWVERIDLDRLDLESPCRCILGQEFGDYFEAIWNEEINTPDTAACGFTVADLAVIGRAAGDREFAALTAEWRRVITERRAAA